MRRESGSDNTNGTLTVNSLLDGEPALHKEPGMKLYARSWRVPPEGEATMAETLRESPPRPVDDRGRCLEKAGKNRPGRPDEGGRAA